LLYLITQLNLKRKKIARKSQKNSKLTNNKSITNPPWR